MLVCDVLQKWCGSGVAAALMDDRDKSTVIQSRGDCGDFIPYMKHETPTRIVAVRAAARDSDVDSTRLVRKSISGAETNVTVASASSLAQVLGGCSDKGSTT